MNTRSPKLSEEDRRAVDLLLNQGNASQTSVRAAHTVVPAKRLAAAEQVLKIIGAMPAEEPPADLVARTMARIDRAAGRAVAASTAAAAQLPHA